jgi:ABC-type sugar transport system permease subunit
MADRRARFTRGWWFILPGLTLMILIVGVPLVMGLNYSLIPPRVDQNASAHSRRPMDRMRQGWSMSALQASQQWATMSS